MTANVRSRAAASAGRDPEPGPDAAACAAPFEIIRPLRVLAPLVSASPHSGRLYPPDMMADAVLDPLAVRRSEDAHVDVLAAPAAHHGWPLILARYARAYVDLNREALELDPALFDGEASGPCARTARAAAGLGSVAQVVAHGQAIYGRRLSFAEAEARLGRVYVPYHAALEALMAEAQAPFGCAVLLDWHSMPAAAAREAGPGPRPDVVLGDRFGRAAAPAVTDLVERAFKARGYRVSRNRPYAGGYVTERHGRPVAHRHAIQIELARALYMDEETLEPNTHFTTLAHDLDRLCAELACADWSALA